MKHHPNYSQILHFFLEAVFGLLIIVGPIYWIDSMDIFDIKDADHNQQRWESLYSLSESTEIDILILGNSHAYTGINPKQLSSSTGMTSFILANNGTLMIDSYWNLKEALTICTPQLILIETTAMNNLENKSDNLNTFLSQMRSFNVRKNIPLKLQATPELFKVDQIVTAWSETVQNHELLLKDPEWLYKTAVRGAGVDQPWDTRLYLGRFAKYTNGLADSTVIQYDIEGPSIIGSDETISEDNVRYTKRIIELGREHGAEVAFVSLPMYEKHIQGAEERHALVQQYLEPLNAPLLDLQLNSQLSRNPSYFQNTRHYNQHMTLSGSMAATQLLSDWIDEKYLSQFDRPGRMNDQKWHQLFEDQEGYLSYYPAKESNPSVRFLLKNVTTPQIKIDEICVLNYDNRLSGHDFFLKMSPIKGNGPTPENRIVTLTVEFEDADGQGKIGNVTLKYDSLLKQTDQWIFRSSFPPLPVLSIKGVKMEFLES